MMTAPMWLANPPEVHSALLSTGAGAAPLFAAAQAWRSLATQYTQTAAELGDLLAATQAGLWQGESAGQYVAAHQPYLAWLADATATATEVASRHEVMAAEYMSALGAMPTLAELAANHATHGVLVATNFLGINTIPIALNEADYTRMWVQAAMTMGAYQAAAEETVATTPQAAAAPRVMAADTTGAQEETGESTSIPKQIIAAFQDFLYQLQDMAQTLPPPFREAVTQILDGFISFAGGQAFMILVYGIVDPIIYLGPFTPLLSPLAGVAGTAGLAGICPPPAQEPLSDEVQAPPEPAQHPSLPPAVVVAPSAAPAPAPSAAPAPAPAPAGTPTPTAPAGAQPFLWAVSGPGGEGFTPHSGARAGVGAPAVGVVATRKKPDESDTDIATSARVRRRSRLHKVARIPGERAMTYADALVGQAVGATDHGAGTLGTSGAHGYAGTSPTATLTVARGLTRLPSDPLQEVPEPMVPQTWSGEEGATETH